MRRLVVEEGIGVLWATHLIDEVAATDSVVVLHKGRILAQGPVPRVIAGCGASDLRDALTRLTHGDAATDEAA